MPGKSTLVIRGATSLDLNGDAQLIPGDVAGTVRNVNLLTQSPDFFYSLEIAFVPPAAPPPGTLSVGAAGPVQAVFYMFDRRTKEYVEIAVARSGTLTLDECSETRCVGRLDANATLANTDVALTFAASFNARIQ